MMLDDDSRSFELLTRIRLSADLPLYGRRYILARDLSLGSTLRLPQSKSFRPSPTTIVNDHNEYPQ